MRHKEIVHGCRTWILNNTTQILNNKSKLFPKCRVVKFGEKLQGVCPRISLSWEMTFTTQKYSSLISKNIIPWSEKDHLFCWLMTSKLCYSSELRVVKGLYFYLKISKSCYLIQMSIKKIQNRMTFLTGFTCQVSGVLCQVSSVKCYMSGVTCFIL